MQVDINFTLTDKAASEINKIRQESTPEETYPYLRISVEGGGCSGFKYGLGFDEYFDESKDYIDKQKEINIVIDKKSALFLNGVILDWIDDINARGFKFINPNATKTCGCGQSFQ
jgi:iron-sulfur cluster assembly protein